MAVLPADMHSVQQQQQLNDRQRFIRLHILGLGLCAGRSAAIYVLAAEFGYCALFRWWACFVSCLSLGCVQGMHRRHIKDVERTHQG